MTDIEKEMELPEESNVEKESSKVSEKKKEETLTEKESSLAADQESVTEKNEESDFKTDSSEKEPEDSPQEKPSGITPPDDSIQAVIEKESEDPALEIKPDKVNHIEKVDDTESKVSDEAAAEVITDQVKTKDENIPTEKEIVENTSEEKNIPLVTEMPAKEINELDDLPKPEKSIINEEEQSKSLSSNTISSIVDKESNAEDSPVVKDTPTEGNPDSIKEESNSIEKEKPEEVVEKQAEEKVIVEEEEKDLSTMAKDELVNEFEALLQQTSLKYIERKYRELKPYYERYVSGERKIALDKFKLEGGAEIDFQYVGDALDNRFSSIYEKYKARRNEFYSDLEKQKGGNLERKQEVLEKLRAIVDGEETNTSIGALKHIQQEWRSIGPVPGQNTKSLWATFNILIDRFYDNRSIYFELKELDRKKNLELKLEICEKAEQLVDREVIRDAVKELNELHEEFKHIGPVPKEMQEAVWQRFKSASDTVYSRRKDYVNVLKKELHENLEEKEKLAETVSQYGNYTSDKISDWNEKTKEVIDLQRKWELIGGLPREHAKEVNKHFWSGFKSFFNSKNKFFKKLEGQRDDNLKLKEELVARADAIKDSDDWEKTAEALKGLQQEWKNTGPVPEKVRNEIYKRFKQACDTFFNRRREHSKDIEGEYKKNLIEKERICANIEKMVSNKEMELDRFKELQAKYESIGFVPRNAIKKIQKKFNYVTEQFLNVLDLSDNEKSEIRFAAEINKLKSSPNADRRIHRKESELRRMISKIENDISLWKNNLEFFAQSKTADKFREEFNEKIDKATDQLKELKDELKMLNKI